MSKSVVSSRDDTCTQRVVEVALYHLEADRKAAGFFSIEDPTTSFPRQRRPPNSLQRLSRAPQDRCSLPPRTDRPPMTKAGSLGAPAALRSVGVEGGGGGAVRAQVQLQAAPLQRGLYHLRGCRTTVLSVSWSQPWGARPPTLGAPPPPSRPLQPGAGWRGPRLGPPDHTRAQRQTLLRLMLETAGAIFLLEAQASRTLLDKRRKGG